MKKVLRVLLFLMPMIACYLGFLISFFGGTLPGDFFGGVSPLLILLISLILFLFFVNLSAPDLKKMDIFSWQIFFVFSFIVLVIIHRGGLFIQDSSVFFQRYGFQLLAGILLIIGILVLIQSKEGVLSNRVHVDTLMIHYSGVFAFAGFVAVFFGLYSFGAFRSIPFSCDDLQSSQEEFMSVIFTPVRKSTEVVQIGKQGITEFLEKDVNETLQGFLQGSVQGSGDIAPSEVTFFQEVKNSVLVAAIEEKKEVDETICAFMIDLIDDKRNIPGLQYSVVFLLFLLLYPLLSVVFVTIGILSFIIFGLCKKLGLWDVRQSMKLVEEME